MKYPLLALVYFVFFSCFPSKDFKTPKCRKIYKNNFKKIITEKYKTIYNNDTVSYNEIRFECVYSAIYTHKAMYDKYGKWDKEIFPSNRNRPILMWENIDLFSNGKEYTVLTNGLEEWKHIYASVMIFDNNQNDLLSNSSTEKTALTALFSDMIKSNNPQKKDFYKVYWQTVDPERWNIIKQNQKK